MISLHDPYSMETIEMARLMHMLQLLINDVAI